MVGAMAKLAAAKAYRPSNPGISPATGSSIGGGMGKKVNEAGFSDLFPVAVTATID
jgi:hypothetical protein